MIKRKHQPGIPPKLFSPLLPYKTTSDNPFFGPLQSTTPSASALAGDTKGTFTSSSWSVTCVQLRSDSLGFDASSYGLPALKT